MITLMRAKHIDKGDLVGVVGQASIGYSPIIFRQVVDVFTNSTVVVLELDRTLEYDQTAECEVTYKHDEIACVMRKCDADKVDLD